MPRIIIDHSANIVEEIGPELFGKLHDYFVSTERFRIEDLKSRAISHENYYLMDGAPDNAFISIHLRIMEGRELGFRNELSHNVLEIAREYFADSLSQLNCNLTCYVSEIEKATYHKLKLA